MSRLDRAQRARATHVPLTDVGRARVHVVPWLTPGTAAMTLGRHIFVRAVHRDDLDLIAHELVHVRQWREYGVPGFLTRYLRAYLAGRFAGLGHWDAYAQIPFEVEARALSGR